MSAVAKPMTNAELLQQILDQPVRSNANLRTLISGRWKMISALLPKHMTEDRFAALVMSAAGRDANVFNCTGESILNAIYQAASLGLEINSATGEAYIIPFKTTATLVPGYKGLIKIAIRSGDVLAIEARLVYKDDVFAVHLGTDSRIEHRYNVDVERNTANVIAAYAVAKMANGATTFDVMNKPQLEAIRRRSPGARKTDSPWNSDTEEMYRKTIVRRLCKYLPLSPQMSEAIELMDRAEPVETTQTPSASDSLNAALRGGASEQGAEPEVEQVMVGRDGQTSAM